MTITCIMPPFVPTHCVYDMCMENVKTNAWNCIRNNRGNSDDNFLASYNETITREIKTNVTVWPLYISGVGCKSSFSSVQHGFADIDGKLELTQYGCQRLCGYNIGKFFHDNVCYGFTFYPATNACYISTNKDYVLTSLTGAEFSQARITCYSSSKFLVFQLYLNV